MKQYILLTLILSLFGVRASAYEKAANHADGTDYDFNTLALTDGVTYTQDTQLKVKTLSFSRNFDNTDWQEICLPFAMEYDDWKDDFEMAYFNAAREKDTDGDGIKDQIVLEFVKIKSGGSTVPNTPYIIRAKETGEKTIVVEDATVYPAENKSVTQKSITTTITLTGCYKNVTNPYTLLIQHYYILNNNKLVRATIANYIKSFHWYAEMVSRNITYDGNEINITNGPIIDVLDEAPKETGTVTLKEGTVDADKWEIKTGETTVEPGVTKVEEGSTVTLTYTGNRKVKSVTARIIDPLEQPLTLEAIENGTITFENNAAGSVTYRINGGEEQTINAGTSKGISVTAKDKVTFFGDNETYSIGNGTSKFSSTADYYAYGNIMSLINSTDYKNATTLTGTRTFVDLFYKNIHLKSHPTKALLLPATTLTDDCYFTMFHDCTGLTSAPALPAKSLATSCYDNMFGGCTSLKEAPDLPATTLAEHCYNAMFYKCESLTELPKLSATALAKGCYSMMFYHCTGIETIPKDYLPVTKLEKECYSDMFRGCTKLSNVPTDLLPATTLAEYCYMLMFMGCSEMTVAPDLPAPTLVDGCYRNMFTDCSKLSQLKCLAEGFTDETYTNGWLTGTPNNSTCIFTVAPGAYWDRDDGSKGIPDQWTVVNE